VARAGTVRERRLALDILTRACEGDLEVGPWVADLALGSGSVKLAGRLIDFLAVLARFNAERVQLAIGPRLLEFVEEFRGLRAGRLVALLPRRGALFSEFIARADEFAARADAGPAFFDILLSAIDSPDDEALFSAFCALQMTADCPGFLFAVICDFYRRFAQYRDQLDLGVSMRAPTRADPSSHSSRSWCAQGTASSCRSCGASSVTTSRRTTRRRLIGLHTRGSRACETLVRRAI
jgi:hypothetical protein